MANLSVSVAAGGDDGVWVEGLSAFDGTEVYIPVGHGGAPYGPMNGFLRFAVALDQGTTINSASIDLVADADRSSSGVRLKIRAILAAAPAAPTTYNGAENATRTAAGVDWDIATGWTNGVTYTSPDFAAVLQELVDAYTITAVVVYLEDDGSNNNNSRRFASYDAGTTPPELTIDYTPPVGIEVTITPGQMQLQGQGHQVGPDVATDIAAGQMQLQGQAFTVDPGTAGVQVTIVPGQMQLVGQSHQVGPDVATVMAAGQLQLQGQTFTIDIGAAVDVVITAGSLQLAGQAHQVGPWGQVTITSGQMQLAGQTFTIDPGAAAVDVVISPAQMQLQGQTFTVLADASDVATTINPRAMRLVAYRYDVDPGAGPTVETTLTAAGSLQLSGPAHQVGPIVATTITTGQLQLLGRPFRIIREAPGLLVGAPTPQTVTLVSANDVDHEAGTISHAVAASANPGAAAALLASDGLGAIQLQRVLIAGDISSPDWVSGQVGFGIEANGAADFRSLFADELTVETFIADVNLALAGSQIIPKSIANLAADFTIPATSATLTVYDLPGLADTAVFADGDWVRLKVIDRSGGGLVVADAWGTVSGYSDQAEGRQSWTWTRQSGTVGLVAGAGGLALDYGQSGDGYWHVTTLQAASPYAEIGTWAGDPSNPANHTVHVRLGQLDGIANRGDEWGLWAGSDPTTRYLAASDGGLEAHGLRLSLYEGTDERIRLDPAVPSLAVGLTLPTGPLAGGAGLWAGIDGGAVQVRIGAPAGDHLLYDGSGLAIVGDGSGVTNINGGNIQTGTVTADRLSVATLSAITADLGTVTAGTINGAEIFAGGNTVTLDSDGITIKTGETDQNIVKWKHVSSGDIVGKAFSSIYGSPERFALRLESGGLGAVYDGEILLKVYGKTYSYENAEFSLRHNIGSIAVEDFRFTDTLRTFGGLTVGAIYSTPGDGDIEYEGDLKPYRNGAHHTGHIYVPLTGNPAQAAHWNNQSRAVGIYTIGVSGFSNGSVTIPSDCKAIAVQIAATSGAAGRSFALGWGGYYDAVNARIPANDNAAWASGIVNVINGDFKGQVAGGTVNVWIRIVGYYI